MLNFWFEGKNGAKITKIFLNEPTRLNYFELYEPAENYTLEYLFCPNFCNNYSFDALFTIYAQQLDEDLTSKKTFYFTFLPKKN